jgi:hypothetical protein
VSTASSSASPAASTQGSEPAVSPAASPVLSVELQVDPEPVEWPTIAEVGAAPAGFLAIADTPSTDTDGESDDERALLLGSPDGTAWQRLDPGPLGGWPYQVAGSQRGWLMTTLAAEPEEVSTLTIWHSEDGRRWAGMPLGKVSGASPVGGPEGYLFLGSPTEGDELQSVAWSSLDGVTWQSVTPPGPEVQDVVATPRCFVAWDSASIFASPTGASWARFDRPQVAEWFGAPIVELNGRLMMFVIADADELTIFASAPFDGSPDPCAFAGEWTEDHELEELFEGYAVVAIPPSEAFPVVYGYNIETLAPVAWSVSGSSWLRHDLARGVFGGGMPASFAVGRGATIAVGVDADVAGSTSTLWRSTDRIAWQPVETEALPGPRAPAGPCPAKPTSIAELVKASVPGHGIEQDWNFTRLVQCFGSDTLRLDGYRVVCECGGISGQLVTPAWRDWFNGGEVFSDKKFEGYGRRVVGFVDPARVSRKPDYDVHVEIAGHFDDPDSSACRVSSLSVQFAELRPPSEAVEICRRQLVVTGFSIMR